MSSMKAKILYEELKRLVDTTKEFAARTPPDCIQNYIHMEFYADDNEVRVCGCDGHKLSLEWGPCKMPTKILQPTSNPIRLRC